MNIFSSYPELKQLLRLKNNHLSEKVLSVNAHIHTPYSFSAFENTEDIFIKAEIEGIKVLGINDFFVTDGYDDFVCLAKRFNIFPLFNIEFIGLLAEEQKQKVRVNDPNNPGRTYFSGKGLRYPFSVSKQYALKLQYIRNESQRHVKQMIMKLQEWLNKINSPFDITYEEVKDSLAKELVRERHIAKMLRIKLHHYFKNENEKKNFLLNLYAGKESIVDINNNILLEEEIRKNLLKMGGPAFVPEDPDAFLPVSEIIKIIVDAGGIPCYPVLLDDNKGNYTEFEADYNKLHQRLTSLNIKMVELIPVRNDIKEIKKFVHYFKEAGFIILFGTEHNTPDMLPLKVAARGNVQLDDELKRIAFEGCCVVAAHQYLIAKGHKGFNGESSDNAEIGISKIVDLGRIVIEKFIN
jgi:hypothetical protein